MRSIEVSDEVYARLERRAAESGIGIEEFLVEITEDSDFSRVFTPGFIAEQHRIADGMASGGESFTTEEVWASLESHKAAHRASSA